MKKAESEVDVEKREILCVVYKELIEGANYLCPKCKTFYCVKYAKTLQRREKSAEYVKQIN